ncbi:MAG TPA: hypothetical protein VGR40_01120, partial [Candidatus Binatus sp.]|nr:hypothetical protein [Candidatus Binatus sp.]
IAIAADPARFGSPDDFALADAVEVFNQRSAWDAEGATSRYLRGMLFGTDYFLRVLDQRPADNLAAYDRLARAAHVTLLAGIGDAENMTVMGAKVGSFQQLFLFYTTHVLATERANDPIIDALRHGHAYVSFDFLGYVPQFAFYAESGGTKTMLGDEASLAASLSLKAELPEIADRVVLLQDGAEVASVENASTLEFAPKSAGAYRIEAYRSGAPWILSNPVYVR